MSQFSTMHWLIVGVIVFILFKVFRGNSVPTSPSICPSCGTKGTPIVKVKGSFGIEIVLWLCFLLPGLIYSIWRLSSRYAACPACDQRGMIPINTPNDQRLDEQFSAPRPTP